MTGAAQALNEQIDLLAVVAQRKGYLGNMNVVQTGRLAASYAFKMHVVVPVVAVGTSGFTKRVSQAIFVEYFVQNSFFDKYF